MKISARVVKNYVNINNFGFGNQWEIRANEPNTLYFQLVDSDLASKDGCQFRYIPIAGCVDPIEMNVIFPSIDDDSVLTIPATPVDAADGSLWKVDLTALQVPASGNVVFELIVCGVTRRFSIMNGIQVEYPGSEGSC